jgi:hypothetical protein
MSWRGVVSTDPMTPSRQPIAALATELERTEPLHGASSIPGRAIVRVDGGNVRLVQRLFSQIARILRINELQTITQGVVDAAREPLVVGALP